MYYQFNGEMAERYGVNEAIFIQNLYFWIKQNQANDKNFFEDRYWTYNTANALSTLFPFWSLQQIKRIIKKLNDNGLLLLGNFNKSKYDRTSWYALSDEILSMFDGEKPKNQNRTMHSSKSNFGKIENEPHDRSESNHPKSEIDPPIPDILPDINTDILPDTSAGARKAVEEIPYKKIMDLYNQTCSAKFGKIVAIVGKRKENVSARFKQFGIDGFKQCFENMSNNPFLAGGGDRGWKADFDWLILPTNFQKVLENKYHDTRTSSGVDSGRKYQNTSYDISALEHHALMHTPRL